jgi:hypothetical protein
MKTEQLREPAPIFAQMVSLALGRLKNRLRRHYQKAYPDAGEIIHRMINEEEARAREISSFPHLIFSDLVAERIGKLGRPPAETRHSPAGLPDDVATTEMPKTVFALCG